MRPEAFDMLLELLREPLHTGRGAATDNSILLVYPPEQELEFREHLLGNFIPLLQAHGLAYHLLDLTGCMFQGLQEQAVDDLCEDEFEDCRWTMQGLSKRLEIELPRRIAALASELAGGTVFVIATVAAYPLVRFGELLRGLRELDCRIVLAFPGEQRGGKLHFLRQPDGANYLAVKVFCG